MIHVVTMPDFLKEDQGKDDTVEKGANKSSI